jgi:microcystin-dependent protein
MSESYVGEIRMFAGNFAPRGWALCNGQLLSIAENEILFSLLGTTYGGDGQATFAVPDLRGRVPVHFGSSAAFGTTYSLGQMGGTETVTLTSQQLPAHSHPVGIQTGQGTTDDPVNAVWANSSLKQYGSGTASGQMSPSAVGSIGGNQPHDNMMPSLGLQFIISLQGYYPSQQ